MKYSPKLLSLLGFTALLMVTSGCVQDHYRTRAVSGHYVPRSPYIGSTQWLTWVDERVDTRYANSFRPDPGTQEWYAIVDHVVFNGGYSRDYYRNIYYREYNEDYRRHYGTPHRHNYADNYYGPARFADRNGGYGYASGYRLGSLEWRRAVTAAILSGRIQAPPPRLESWDAPLSPNSNR